MSRPRLPRVTKRCARTECDQTFEARQNAADAHRLYCSRQCARSVENQARSIAKQKAWNDGPESLCACGRGRIPYEVRHTTLYCSTECRTLYGKKRQADPTKQITFCCGTCGKEQTRPRTYGSTISGKRFCDRYCAAKHTKTVKHYVAREMDMVLDSTWEVLFAGLCGYLKIEASRVDRSLAVTASDGSTYAPDFLVDGRIWVEVKGRDNGGQHEGWSAWREQVGPLVVVGTGRMDALRSASGRNEFLATITKA